jgi:mitochondrial fission protein ELM1
MATPETNELSGPSLRSAPSVRVVIASDSKRGHENQSRVLARMLGDTEPLIMRLRNPEGGIAERILRARFALPGPQSLSQSEAAALVRLHLKPESPDEFRNFAAEVGKHRAGYRVFTVSTGTPPGTMNLLLARLLGAEPLCVMTPSMLPRKLFRLMVVPEHDLKAGYVPVNVLTTPLALSYYDQSAADLQANQLIQDAGLTRSKAYWAIAIGGPSKSVKWNEEEFKQELLRIVSDATRKGSRLLITTSRRTTRATSEFAQSAAAGHTDYFLDASTDSRNPLPGFYELSDTVAVTDDSYSMICEAIQAGFAPKLMEVGSQNLKLNKAISKLVESGLAEPSPEYNYMAEIRRRSRQTPNAEYNQLRGEVRKRFQLD